MLTDKPSNPFPSNDPQKIYAPPEQSSKGPNFCPSCGLKMEEGELYSSSLIKWSGVTTSKMKKFVSGGETIAKTKSGFGCRYSAYRCEHCKIYKLLE